MRRLEFYVQIPLGFTKTRKYHLEHLATTTGWHYRYLLVCLDKTGGKWRLQSQLKYRPLTRWTHDHE